MADTLKTVIEGYTDDGARIALSRCEALILTHLLNRGPMRLSAIQAACRRQYAEGTIPVVLTSLRKKSLVDANKKRGGHWRAL